MTTIAAFRDHRGDVAIAADRLVSTGALTGQIRKIHEIGNMIVGHAGVTLVQRAFAILQASEEAAELDIVSLEAAVHEWMKAREHGKQDDDGNHYLNTEIIVIPRVGDPGPWYIGPGGSILKYEEGYVTVGSGSSVAAGVLYMARKRKWTAATTVKTALDAACHHDVFTAGPVDVVVIRAGEG